MILLDPDLDPESPHGRRPVRGDPDPAPKTTLAKRVGASTSPLDSKTASRRVQLPSARTLSRFLTAAQTALRLKGQVTVLLTTDAAIARLNRQFRGKNKATDVLSFPADGPIRGSHTENIAGDLAISVTTALGQAAEQGHSLSTEIKVLILHGLLHLAGHDHEVDDGKMARREQQLRAKLKLPQGLIERGAVPQSRDLKGHGLSRAAKSPKRGAALAAEGMLGKRRTAPQGLKPSFPVANAVARLKPGPFKAPAKAKRP